MVAKVIDLRAKIERADIVITGEGKLDGQTLAGKGPVGAARMARALQKAVYAIVGQATDDPEARQLFDGVYDSRGHERALSQHCAPAGTPSARIGGPLALIESLHADNTFHARSPNWVPGFQS